MRNVKEAVDILMTSMRERDPERRELIRVLERLQRIARDK